MLDIQINKQLPVIGMNFEEVKASLEETMSKYKGLIVTEETLKDCKEDKRKLASLRNNIDTYRKDVKREFEQPIKIADKKFKSLIELVKEAEEPINEGIKVFDDKRREEKRLKALEIIQEAIEKHQLNNNYASRLTVVDKYMNLTGSIKAVKDDVELRALSLANEQKQEEERKQLAIAAIKASIDRENKRLKSKLNYEDSIKNIDILSLDMILEDIERKAELIYKAENPPKEEVKAEVKIPADLKAESKEERKCFVEFKVEHNYEMIQALSRFLQDGAYEYEVKNKGYVD